MERVTFRPNKGNVGYRRFCVEQDALDRLAAYEDAEEQGLLVWLPCAPGDEVWVVERAESGEAVDVVGYMFLSRAGDAVILSAYI